MSATEGRHVVVMTCHSADRPRLLREVANGCTQLLLELREHLDGGQTVTIESVDVVEAHGMHTVSIIPNLMSGVTTPTTAVVITALVKTKPPDTADSAFGAGGQWRDRPAESTA